MPDKTYPTKASPIRLTMALFIALLAHATAFGQESGQQFFHNYFLTGGDHTAAGVGLADKNLRGVARGVLRFDSQQGNQAPEGAEVVAAFLYWQTAAKKRQGDGAMRVQFNGFPLYNDSGPLGKRLGEPLAAECSPSDSRQISTFRADVLRFLPIDPETGRHLLNDRGFSIEIGGGSRDNSAPVALGASLVVIYRQPSVGQLRSIVVYDGPGAPAEAASAVQPIQGFYDPLGAAAGAKLSVVAGLGRPDAAAQLSLRYGSQTVSSRQLASQSGWATLTLSGLPSPTGSGVAVSAAMEGATPGCLPWVASIFQTPVRDSDRDGLLDLWESSTTTLLDPNGEPLPNLQAMGAHAQRPDIFLEIGYLFTPTATNYGGAQAPRHTHLPTPEALRQMGQAFANQGITVHYDAGAAYVDPLQRDLLGFANRDPFAVLPPACRAENPALPPSPAAACMVTGDGLARGGAALEETATSANCEEDPERPWVCQFADHPGTIGWKNGYRFFRDQPLSPSTYEECEEAEQDGLATTACRRRFDQNRRASFRYALFAHALGIPKEPCLIETGEDDLGLPDFDCMDSPVTGSEFRTPVTNTGVADFQGADLMVTLGGFQDDRGLPVGSTYMQAATLMHELGHTFGRRHGGDVLESNCNPNYLSVMNYLFQLRGLVDNQGVARLDFSGQTLSPLDETDLDEVPLSGNPVYRSAWYAPLGALARQLGLPTAKRYCNGVEFAPGERPLAVRMEAQGVVSGPIDWNADGDVEDLGLRQDINFDGRIDGASAAGLRGSNDWSNLQLDQVGIRRNVGSWFLVPNPEAPGESLAFIGPTSLGFGRGDLGRGDLGRGDLGRGDLGRGDLGRGDLGRGDLGRGDLGRGDLGRGDLGRGDLGRGDLGRGDLGRGDLGRGDLGDGNLLEVSADVAADLGNSPPNNLQATVLDSACFSDDPACNRIQLTWSPPNVGVVSGYFVYRVEGDLLSGNIPQPIPANGGGSPTFQVPANQTSLIDFQPLPNGVQFTYYVRAEFQDGSASGLSNPAVILAINEPPTANPDSYSTPAGVKLTVPVATGVLNNDVDADSPSFTAELVTSTSNGLLTFQTDGSFMYQPNVGFSGQDSFTYRANDGNPEASAPAKVTITVQGYTLQAVQNLPPAGPVNSGGVLPLDWRFLLNGAAVAGADAAPRITIQRVGGAAVVYTPAQPGASSFRAPTGGGTTWGFDWRMESAPGVALPAGDYVVTIQSLKTGQTFNAATIQLQQSGGYQFQPVTNLGSGIVKTSGTVISLEWRFLVNGAIADTSDARPVVRISRAGGPSFEYKEETEGDGEFRRPNFGPSRIWGFDWRTRFPTGAREPFPPGEYTISIESRKTGQVFQAGSIILVAP